MYIASQGEGRVHEGGRKGQRDRERDGWTDERGREGGVRD